MDKESNTRYTLVLEPEAVRAIERLQTAYGLKTKAAAYELATRVLTWATDQWADGYEVGRVRDYMWQPLLMPNEPDAGRWLRDRITNGSNVEPNTVRDQTLHRGA